MPKDVISLPLRFVVIKRSKRIHGRDNVASILKDGTSASTPFFIIRKRPNGAETNRYAFVLSKKLERSAVKRNKKRRQVYEILRILEKEGGVANLPSFDIVLLARKPIPTASYDELEKALRAIFQTHQPGSSEANAR